MSKYQTPEGVKTHDYKVLEEFDADGFPDDLDEVISLLQAWRAKYPGHLLNLEIGNGRYDGDGPNITLTSWVPRPAEEVAKEVRRISLRQTHAMAEAEASERRQLATLIAKYGVPE